MGKKKVMIFILGVLCLGGGIGIGVGLSTYISSRPVVSEMKNPEITATPTSAVEKSEKQETNSQESEEIEDPNEACKYTKEMLEEDDRKRQSRYEEENGMTRNSARVKSEYIASSDSYLIEESDREKIDQYQLYELDEELLALARNEIFARHGYIFTKENYKACFENKSWYIPSKKINEIQLSEVEQYNVTYLEWQEKCMKETGNLGSGSIYSSEKYVRDFCNMYRFNVDRPFKIDLNNDGIKEEIEFESTAKDNWCVSSGIIKINGEPQMEVEGFFQHYIWVVDIDETDDYVELVINDMGPSSDYQDKYFYYNGKKLEFMGQVTGEINSDSNHIRNYVQDGILHATQRWDDIGTAWYNCDYRLTTEHILEEIPCDYYRLDWKTYARSPITLYDTKQLSSNKVEYKIGLPMTIIGTDLKEWVEVQLEDGKSAWFNTNEFDGYGLDGASYFD